MAMPTHRRTLKGLLGTVAGALLWLGGCAALDGPGGPVVCWDVGLVAMTVGAAGVSFAVFMVCRRVMRSPALQTLLGFLGSYAAYALVGMLAMATGSLWSRHGGSGQGRLGWTLFAFIVLPFTTPIVAIACYASSWVYGPARAGPGPAPPAGPGPDGIGG